MVMTREPSAEVVKTVSLIPAGSLSYHNLLRRWDFSIRKKGPFWKSIQYWELHRKQGRTQTSSLKISDILLSDERDTDGGVPRSPPHLSPQLEGADDIIHTKIMHRALVLSLITHPFILSFFRLLI